MNVRLVHPPEFKLMPGRMSTRPQTNARASGGSLELMDDFDAGFRGSDVVYAKSWGPLLTAKDDADGRDDRRTSTPDWITDERRMELAAPTTRSTCTRCRRTATSRSTDGVIDGPQSVVYDEAENRLHAQKAVMALTMG